MTNIEVITLWVMISGGLGALVIFIANITKLRDYIVAFKKWKREQFAKKQQPYCQLVCSAPAYMADISKTLKEIKIENAITREISLETLGNIMIQKSIEACEKGYMEQNEKDNLIHSFIPYDIGRGNGRVLYHVGLAMDLPTTQNGTPCDVDMSAIIERERERYALKQKNI